MPTDDLPIQEPPGKAIVPYEAALPLAHQTVRVPRSVHLVHRFFMGSMSVISLVYGIVLMIFGWLFKQAGLVFLPPSRRRRKSSRDRA